MDAKTIEMRRTYLVQRLRKPMRLPADNPLAALAGAFSFGGGLVNGGLSKDAMGLLRDLFSFDYMGSAEFEWGAVPEALSGLARDASRLTAFSFEIPLRDVAPHWKDRKADKPEGAGTVYALCRSEQATEVERRIRDLAKQGYTARLKEATRLDSALRPRDEWDTEVAGWLELDNGFLFFTDRDMWAGTCCLFGVEP